MNSTNDDHATTNSISRKDFVKASSLAAGGLMVGSLPFSGRAKSAGAATLNIALVGCGGRGTGAARQALSTGDGVQLVAMAHACQDRLDESYETLNKVVDAEKPEKRYVP